MSVATTQTTADRWLRGQTKAGLISIIIANIDRIQLFEETQVSALIEVLQCQHCPRRALAFAGRGGGLRITGHKCAGAWATVETFKASFSLRELMLHAEIKCPPGAAPKSPDGDAEPKA